MMDWNHPTRRALVGALLLGALAAAAVVGCGRDESGEDDRVVVEFWHAMGRDHQNILNTFVREFEEQNPDVHVRSVFQGHYGQLSQKLIASVIARSNPVMAQMYEGWTARFLTRDLLDPVQNHIDGPDGLTPEEVEDFWEPFRRNNSWDGQLVTLPFNKSGYLLYANMDMLEAAGYDAPPKTWAELRAMTRALTVRENENANPQIYGFLVRSSIEAFTQLLFRAGGSCLSEDDKSVTVNSPVALQTLELLRDIIVTDRSGYADSGYPAFAFGSGKVAMYIHTSAAFRVNDLASRGRFRWIAAPLPHPEGSKGGTLFQGTNIGIFSRPHPPEVRAAAWRFLKFITNPTNTARWSVHTGYVPVRKSALETPEMKEFLKTHPNNLVPISLIPEAVFDPRPHYWDQMRPRIRALALDAMNGRRDPAQALATMETQLQALIDYEAR